jgi:hypothetical protein
MFYLIQDEGAQAMYSRRDIFLRAHQLVSWNPSFVRQDGRAATFARFLRHAWNEAKAGTLPSFAPAAVRAREIAAVQDNITGIWNKDRLFAADYAFIRQLEAKLDALIALPVAA